MKDQDKTREQLIVENEELRWRVAAMERIEAERMQAEEELRESEERYRLLAEAIPHPVWRSDAEGRQIDCNRRWQEYTGQTPEEAQGDGWMKALHPDDVARAIQRVREDVPGGTIYQAEYRLHRASDDTYHWYLARAIPRRDANGTIIGWFGSAVDIDDQKRAEEALAERETRLLEAQEVASLGFYVHDIATGRWTSSSVLDRILGIPADYVRTVEGWDDLVHPDERQAMLDYFTREVVGERKPFDREYRIVRYGDNEVRWVHGLGRLRFNEEEQPISMLGTIQDVTEHKRAEEALQKTHEELEQRVEERTAELTKANEDLQREIEEHKRSEAALLEAKRFSDTIIESIPGPFYVVDRSGKYIRWNKAQQEIAGVSSEAMLQTNCLSTIHDDDRDTISKTLAKFNKEKEKKHVELEARVLTKAGVRDFFLTGKRMDIGKTFFIVGCGTDITERKQAEESLRQSERRFRNYFEQGLIGMAVTSVDKRWLEVNDRLCEILGYSREELLRTNWTILTYPDDLEPNIRLYGPLLAGEIEHFTLNKRYFKKDGSIVYTTIHTRAFRTDDGKVDHIITLVEDITPRKQAQEALRISEERLRLAQQVARVGTFEWNIQTGLNTWMPELEALYGLSPGSFPKTEPAWQNLVYPDDRAEAVRLKEQTLETGQPVEGEWRVVWPDGSVHWLAGRWQAFKDDSGKPLRLIGVNIDITEHKQAQEALERERQSLWRMLQVSDHERQTISYEIHDGLAQYLAAATMQLQVFDGLRDSNPEEAKKAYDAATQLVSQSHSEARRLISEVRPPIIDENGIEMAISHLVHEQRRRGGPKIECRSDVQFGRLPAILENALYRIVQEALTNACKHSKSKKVTVTMTQEGQDVRLEVQDWGIGFDPESVEKGHFGLEGIRQRVRLLGGRLTIESTPGAGTLIQVVVPILEKQNDG